MGNNEIAGMIDIGSNTVRLAVYEMSDNGAYKVIDQGRWAARLSQRMTAGGELPDNAVRELSHILRHFASICKQRGAQTVRAVATAAVRQAANRRDVVARLREASGIPIEILSGEEEARIGSTAMLATMAVRDGFVVDIGGGSTEISLVRNRRIVNSASFPIGCVNLSERHAIGDGPIGEETLAALQAEVRAVVGRERWLTEHPGLPLIGLGGTVRALAKLHQRRNDYPLTQLHGYEMAEGELADSLGKLAAIPVHKRRKLPGLSKDRGDVIVPGLAILTAAIRLVQSPKLVVCGAGLRDGLFFETCLPRFRADNPEYVLEESIRNLTALYPTAPAEHLLHVRNLAVALHDRLFSKPSEEARKLLETASRLFRIGAAIDFGDCADHTFYMLLHVHWNGMTHREMALTAAVASYRGPGPLRRKLAPYRVLLKDGDVELAAKLGSLLQLAAALDRSESQAISGLEIVATDHKLRLVARAAQPLPVEQTEVSSLAKEFRKIWGLTPELEVLAPLRESRV